jgi:hypothetical protein
MPLRGGAAVTAEAGANVAEPSPGAGRLLPAYGPQAAAGASMVRVTARIGGLIELDAIIWATGMTFDWLSTIQTIGRGSVRLSQVWANNDPCSYLGGTVPGLPNLFINDGPNTGVATGGGGHNFMTETVYHYAFECLQLLVERGGTSIEVTRRAHDEHNELIEREKSKLLWSYERKASTYYRNEAGRVILPSPFRPETFWSMCQKPDETKFVIHNPAQIASVAYE